MACFVGPVRLVDPTPVPVPGNLCLVTFGLLVRVLRIGIYSIYYGCGWGSMAGLGLFFHESALALAPRGLLQSVYDFVCLIYTKRSRASRKGPGQF